MSDLEIRKNCLSLVLDCFSRVQTITANGPDTLIVWANASVNFLAGAMKPGLTKEEVEKTIESINFRIKIETVKLYLSRQEET